MKKWEKVLLVKEKKTKLQAIKLVGDVEGTLFIDERDFVLIVALENLLNSANQAGETGIDLLMDKNLFIVSFKFSYFIIIRLVKNCKFFIRYPIYTII